MHSHKARLSLLLLLPEFRTWGAARHWSYAAQLGIEEGLRANGVKFLTITSPWFSRAREIYGARRFDQVWVEIVHFGSPRTGAHPKDVVDDSFLEWLAGVAPIRVGFVPESLQYEAAECESDPCLRHRRERVLGRLKWLTHVVAADEQDAADITARGNVSALWWPQGVPRRFIVADSVGPRANFAAFHGGLYGEREALLQHDALKGILKHLPSPEAGTIDPLLFQCLHLASRFFIATGLPGSRPAFSAYLRVLRNLRRRCFGRWIRALQLGHSVVNLPSRLKAYPGRVYESMAAGRPVITWEIPNRPRNRMLFENGKEILMYQKDDIDQLAEHIRHVQADPVWSGRIVANARKKLERFHTVEKRVEQILAWIDSRKEPRYA